MTVAFGREIAPFLALGAFAVFIPFSNAADTQSIDRRITPGLRVSFESLEGSEPRAQDVAALPNLCLYVPAGSPATSFIPSGRFTASWRGFVSVDLRSDYRFQAELNGEFKMEVNGVVVLEATGTGAASSPSRFIRLNKGTNLVTATFRSPPRGDAFVRVEWMPKGGLSTPIPLSALSHQPDEELERTARLRLGRALFIEHRCGKCHSAGVQTGNQPELELDAPSFQDIGARRNSRWMAQWILDPKGQRASAHMPKLFHGPNALKDAEAAATFLVSLKSASTPAPAIEASAGQIDAGKQLFDALHCAACHNDPDGAEASAERISLKHVAQKFRPGHLALFLKNPAAHYAWSRMPNFKLDDEEARHLAVFLAARADQATEKIGTIDTAAIERGKKLVQTTGCLNCHSLKLENQFAAKPLADLPAPRWSQGCLASVLAENSKAPFFAFESTEREALQGFAAGDRAALMRFVPAEFAARQISGLKCQECHGKIDGFPPVEILGGKLKPEWITDFLAGKVSYKPRPWLSARMPAFAAQAEALGHGMAMLHGYAPKTSPEPPIDAEAAKIGQKLVSADGGFSCVACHAVGKVGANLVFDSAGINLAYAAERLQRPYFVRWLFNPLSIEPSSKMPVYFDETGRSPLTDVFEGDGAKQIDAIWQYLRLGDKMPPPPGTEPAP
ncbi:MAG: cytochrome c [Verrucomicrobia bacterium]|nr:cytochrome c [Verrucomicrobiota bacterium]